MHAYAKRNFTPITLSDTKPCGAGMILILFHRLIDHIDLSAYAVAAVIPREHRLTSRLAQTLAQIFIIESFLDPVHDMLR